MRLLTFVAVLAAVVIVGHASADEPADTRTDHNGAHSSSLRCERNWDAQSQVSHRRTSSRGFRRRVNRLAPLLGLSGSAAG